MQLVLHIGAHKTGSTALQQFCAQNTDWLAERGVYYPVDYFSVTPKQHSTLAKLANKGDADQISEFFSYIEDVAHTLEASQVLLSGEAMSTLRDKALENLLAGAWPHFDRIQAVLVLRNKRDWLYSNYTHHLNKKPEQVTPSGYVKGIHFEPAVVVNRWQHCLGQNNLKLYLYDFIQHNLVQHVLADTLGLEMSSAREITSANVSFDLITAQLINDVLKEVDDLDTQRVTKIYWQIFGEYRPRFRIENLVAEMLDKGVADESWSTGPIADFADVLLEKRNIVTDEAVDVGIYLMYLERFINKIRAELFPGSGEA